MVSRLPMQARKPFDPSTSRQATSDQDMCLSSREWDQPAMELSQPTAGPDLKTPLPWIMRCGHNLSRISLPSPGQSAPIQPGAPGSKLPGMQQGSTPQARQGRLTGGQALRAQELSQEAQRPDSLVQQRVEKGRPLIQPLRRVEYGEAQERETSRWATSHTGLPAAVQAKMGHIFHCDFAGVNIHANSHKAAAIGAVAYTQGQDIYFAPGKFQPNSRVGHAILGHELTHVVQQAQGRVQATTQTKGLTINNDPALEQEAHVMGATAARDERVSHLETPSWENSEEIGARVRSGAARIKRPGWQEGLARAAGEPGQPCAATTPVTQALFGFELELQVMLSQGPPSTESSSLLKLENVGQDIQSAHTKGVFQDYTLEDLKQGKIKLRPQVEKTRHHVVIGKDIYIWHQDSKAQADDIHVIRPANVSENESGRWHKAGTFTGDPEKDEAQYFDPLLKKEEKIFQATEQDPFDVVEDHATRTLDGLLASIIEFVTVPRDEYDPKGDAYILRPITRAQEIAQDITTRTKDFKIRIPAQRIFPGAPPDLYLGANLFRLIGKSDQTDAASVQATYAVQLASIPALFQDIIKGPKRLEPDEVEVLQNATKAAQAVMIRLALEGIDDRTAPGLRGLLHLLSMYLSGGHPKFVKENSFVQHVNIKNYVPLLIRPYLTTLVEQVKPTFSPAASKLLSDKEFVTETLVPLLAQANGRELSEWVFTGDSDKESPPPLIGKWLAGVLLGKEDQIRTRGRFGRAKVLPPEPVGPRGTQQLGVPLEERQVPFQSDALGLVPVNQWDTMAEAYLKRLRSYNRPLRSAESQQETSSMLSPGPFPDVSSVVTSTSAPTAVQPSQSASGLLADGTHVEAQVGTRTLIGTIQGKEQGKYRFKPDKLNTIVPVDYDKVKVIL